MALEVLEFFQVATFRDDGWEKQPGDVGMKEARRGYPCPVCNDPTE